MKTKHINLTLLVSLVLFTVSCSTTVTSPMEKEAKQDDTVSVPVEAVFDTFNGDTTISVRVLEVVYNGPLASTVFECDSIGASGHDKKLIRVRPSNCYNTLKVVHPNDTITIWVHPCLGCVEGRKYMYPICEKAKE